MPPRKTAKSSKTSKSSKKSTPKASVGTLQIHGGGKIAKIKQDDNCEASIRDFVVDKLKIGSFQLLTQPDDSGTVVRLSDVQKHTGTDLYVRERNKAQA